MALDWFAAGLPNALKSIASYTAANSAGYSSPANPYPAGGAAAGAAPGTTAVDWEQQLKDDLALQAALNAIGSQRQAYGSDLGAQYARTLALYGAVPDNLNFGDTNFSSFVTPEVRALAQSATSSGVSTLAQLQHAYDIANQHSDSSLAARNMLRSGAFGQERNANLRNYDIGQYTATQALLDSLGGAYRGYLGSIGGLNQQASDATNQALQRVIQKIQAGLLGGVGAAPRAGGGSGQQQAAPSANNYADSGTQQYVPAFGPTNPWAPGGAVSKGAIPYENQPLMDTRSVGGYIAPWPQYGLGGI